MNTFQFNKENVLCISLETELNLARWENIQKRAAKINLPISKWVASTPQTLLNSFNPYLNDGQKACAQSHYNIWSHMVKHEMKYVLILEDDACFDKLFHEKLNTLSLPDDWDAIFLNASEPAYPLHTWTKADNQYLTGGYILSLAGAKTLLNEWNHIPLCASDWMTKQLQGYNKCYTYFPWLIIQEGQNSTIGGHYKEDHQKVIECLQSIQYSMDNYVI